MGNHVIQYPKEYSLCVGCQSCELVCALAHEGATSLQFSRIKLKKGPLGMPIHTVFTCQQCDDNPCYQACPLKDKAMCVDENNIVYINEDACVGCGLCQRACPETPARIYITKKPTGKGKVAKKCDLCRGREGGPACVEFCASCCLGLSAEPLPYGKEESK